MPGTFQQKMTDSQSKIAGMYAELLTLTQQKTQGTQEKIKANNTLYVEKILEICKDGQSIYRFDDTIKPEFVYETVLELSRGAHQTGFKGTIYSEETGQELEGVKISSLDGKYATLTNEEGHFDFQKIAAATYKFKIEKDGYETQIVEVTLETGVAKTLKYKLKAVTPVSAN